MLTTDAAGQRLEALKHEEVKGGFPSEAFSDQALFWAYVLSSRQLYEQSLERPAADVQAQALLQGVAIDKKLLTEPLNDQQLKAANAWKLAYLRRLRREKTDESYINAYLSAWNLSPSEVFGQ